MNVNGNSCATALTQGTELETVMDCLMLVKYGKFTPIDFSFEHFSSEWKYGLFLFPQSRVHTNSLFFSIKQIQQRPLWVSQHKGQYKAEKGNVRPLIMCVSSRIETTTCLTDNRDAYSLHSLDVKNPANSDSSRRENGSAVVNFRWVHVLWHSVLFPPNEDLMYKQPFSIQHLPEEFSKYLKAKS